MRHSISDIHTLNERGNKLWRIATKRNRNSHICRHMNSVRCDFYPIHFVACCRWSFIYRNILPQIKWIESTCVLAHSHRQTYTRSCVHDACIHAVIYFLLFILHIEYDDVADFYVRKTRLDYLLDSHTLSRHAKHFIQNKYAEMLSHDAKRNFPPIPEMSKKNIHERRAAHVHGAKSG